MNIHEINIEKMFENEILGRKDNDGRGLSIKSPKPTQLILDNGKGIEVSEGDVDSRILKDAMSDIEITGGKRTFAYDVVPGLGKGDFQAFTQLFDLIDEILED